MDEDVLGPTTRWWWIRHAPVPQLADRIYGNTDPDADVSDVAAFRQLAARLPRDAVWVVSHLRRTHQTARAIGEAGYPLPAWAVEEDLGEQDFGRLHGVRHVDHAASRTDPYRGFWPLDPHDPAPEGESLAGVFERVASTVERISASHRGRDVVCVSHGGAILGALAQALSLPPEAAVRVAVANLTMTRIHRLHEPRDGGPGWRVLGIAERPIAS